MKRGLGGTAGLCGFALSVRELSDPVKHFGFAVGPFLLGLGTGALSSPGLATNSAIFPELNCALCVYYLVRTCSRTKDVS